jgi:hypothetical protein
MCSFIINVVYTKAHMSSMNICVATENGIITEF